MVICAIFAGIVNVDAKTSKKSKTTTSSAKKTVPSTGNYALFHDGFIPFDGVLPTVQDFGLKGAVKTFSEYVIDYDAIGYSNVNMKFDKNGRLTFQESSYDDAYGPERYEITYGDDDRVKNIIHTYQPTTQDGTTPLIKAVYDYTWENGKVKEISETLTIDGGINYSGKTTHLIMQYDQNGNLIAANCKENPKVYFKYDGKNRLLESHGYDVSYKNYIENGSRLDSFFTDVNKKKAALKWDSYNLPDQYISVEEMNSHSGKLLTGVLNTIPTPGDPNFSVTEPPYYTYDGIGNWISAIVSYDGGETEYKRHITYY